MNNAYLGGVACGIVVTASLFLFQKKAHPIRSREKIEKSCSVLRRVDTTAEYFAGFNTTAYFLISAAFGASSGYLITDAKITECRKTLKQKLDNESRQRRPN